MPLAIRIHQTGGADVLSADEVPVPQPAAGELLIRQEACGVNFIDTYQRSGLYPLQLPAVLGLAGAGTVTALGEGVSEFALGDRVAYGTGPLGGYAEERVIPAARVVPLPEAIPFDQAGGMMLRGLTAQFLVRRTYAVGPSTTALVHAAAGGVGQLLVQWLEHLGATVIATAGGPEKVALVRGLGAHHVIDYADGDFVAAVKSITGGQGVDVVYDGVGRVTFMPSLDCLRRLGMMVSFGNASGPVDPISPLLLSQKGSLFLTRPTLFDYMRETAVMRLAAAELFEAVASGAVKVDVGARYALADAAQAHRDLEARKTTGSVVLIP